MIFLFKKSFDKSYAKLNHKIKVKFEERLGIFNNEPTSIILNIHKLNGEYIGLWSMNITADVRAIFEKKDNDLIIFIDIGTHSDLFE